MSASLNKASVIVTGASKGIGKGIARVFASHKAKVLVVARNPEEGEATAAELRATGAQAAFCCADVTRREDVARMVDTAVRLHGGLDVLCCNAGAFPACKLADMSDEAWDSLFATNVRSLMLCVQAATGALRQSKAPRIVVTSSITGPVTGFPGWSHYAATKAAQLGFMRTAAIELARDGITINAVMPGNILTEALQGMGEDYVRSTAACVPLGRLGTVEDIGHAAAFLGSAEAGYITGQTLIIDGGQVLPESPAALSA